VKGDLTQQDVGLAEVAGLVPADVALAVSADPAPSAKQTASGDAAETAHAVVTVSEGPLVNAVQTRNFGRASGQRKGSSAGERWLHRHFLWQHEQHFC
jgi:hypothetical protein